MLKQFVFIFTVVLCISAVSFAQEKTEKQLKDSHQKMEMNKVQKIDSLKTISNKPWNAVCPVKGNEVDDITPTVEYDGKVYGFCCPGCDAKFSKNPEKYAKNLSEDGKKFIGRK